MQIKIHITGKRLRNRLCYCPSSTFRQVKSIELNATNGLADVNENELSLNCFKLHLQVVFPSESHEFVINNSNTLHGICIQQNTLAREHIHSGASKRFTISFYTFKLSQWHLFFMVKWNLSPRSIFTGIPNAFPRSLLTWGMEKQHNQMGSHKA